MKTVDDSGGMNALGRFCPFLFQGCSVLNEDFQIYYRRNVGSRLRMRPWFTALGFGSRFSHLLVVRPWTTLNFSVSVSRG